MTAYPIRLSGVDGGYLTGATDVLADEYFTVPSGTTGRLQRSADQHNAAALQFALYADVILSPESRIGRTAEGEPAILLPTAAPSSVGPGRPDVELPALADPLRVVGEGSRGLRRTELDPDERGISSLERERRLYAWACIGATWRLSRVAAAPVTEERAGGIVVPWPVLLAGVACVGILTTALIYHLNVRAEIEATTARQLAGFRLAAQDQVQALAQWRQTGQMPPPTPAQTAAADAIRTLAREGQTNWQRDAGRAIGEGVSSGIKFAGAGLALYLVIKALGGRNG